MKNARYYGFSLEASGLIPRERERELKSPIEAWDLRQKEKIEEDFERERKKAFHRGG